MAMKTQVMNVQKIIPTIILTVGVLLMIPLVAMQFTSEVNWTLIDFVAAGVLLFGTGLTYVLLTRVLAPRLTNRLIYRVAVGFSLLVGLFLVWANLAVGLF